MSSEKLWRVFFYDSTTRGKHYIQQVGVFTKAKATQFLVLLPLFLSSLSQVPSQLCQRDHSKNTRTSRTSFSYWPFSGVRKREKRKESPLVVLYHPRIVQHRNTAGIFSPIICRNRSAATSFAGLSSYRLL